MAPRKNRPSYADQRVLDTVESLIEIYKKYFGNDWQRIFGETVAIDVAKT